MTLNIVSAENVDPRKRFVPEDIESRRSEVDVEVITIGGTEGNTNTKYGVTMTHRRSGKSKTVLKQEIEVTGEPGEDAVVQHFTSELGAGKFDDNIRIALNGGGGKQQRRRRPNNDSGGKA